MGVESRVLWASGVASRVTQVRFENRASRVWQSQDGSHRRRSRTEADNAKLVLEDRGSDTATPLNWNLKSILRSEEERRNKVEAFTKRDDN